MSDYTARRYTILAILNTAVYCKADEISTYILLINANINSWLAAREMDASDINMWKKSK